MNLVLLVEILAVTVVAGLAIIYIHWINLVISQVNVLVYLVLMAVVQLAITVKPLFVLQDKQIVPPVILPQVVHQVEHVAVTMNGEPVIYHVLPPVPSPPLLHPPLLYWEVVALLWIGVLIMLIVVKHAAGYRILPGIMLDLIIILLQSLFPMAELLLSPKTTN